MLTQVVNPTETNDTISQVSVHRIAALQWNPKLHIPL